MEYPFSSKEKGMGYWIPPGLQADSSASLDNGARNSILEDPFGNFSDLMNFEGYAGLCNSPSTTEQILASYGLPISPSAPYGSLDMMNFVEQSSFYYPDHGGVSNAVGSSSTCVDRLAFQQADSQLDYQLDSNDQSDSGAKQGEGALGRLGISGVANNAISRPLARSLDEKMLRALSLFKEYSGGGILAQVWVPIKLGDQYVLSTCEQPYLLDKMLEGYREVSRTFTFSAEGKPGTFLGLPGRVFTSKVPEWTSNVMYYNNSEYLRVKHAVHHNIRGSIALPVFDCTDKSCCAVLELVTMKEKANFDLEMEKVCLALQAVNLRTTPPRLLPQCLSRNQRTALAEISDILRAVCHAHRFPLALTWIPCCFSEGAADEIVRIRVRDSSRNANEKCILCIEDTACYVNDKEMQGFVHACAEHYLAEGQGLAGKALQSNHPFFYPDVKAYDINAYPLVHHARRFGLNAAVAIRLRSTFTGDDDYILEFFLPVNIKGSAEQQLLLDNLSRTMQRICKTLRTVSDAELFGTEDSKAELQEVSLPNMSPIPAYRGSHQTVLSNNGTSSTDSRPSNVPTSRRTVSDLPREQVTSVSRRQHEKKQSTAEKTVSLSVLQQYFSGSLKDAAKSIGVCPTTLKRICRQHGISRWPSRKINKVNRSLKKIQTVLDSVQGVEGRLKFDPNTGGFVASGSMIEEFDARNNSFPDKKPAVQNQEASIQEEEKSIPFVCGNNSAIKLEDEYCVGAEHSGPSTSSLHLLNICHGQAKKSSISQIEYRDDSKSTAIDDGIVEHNRPASSSLTDSSYGSGSIMHCSSSSSQSFEEGKHPKERTSSHESGSKVTVKATYKDDTIRFKFEPSTGCFQLYEEVSKRFKLQSGTFQLKYLDDEDEWVMLVSDSDLQECLEIMEYVGTRSVKFLVRDVPAAMGSSGSSNCFLAGCS
ncbi:protein NLP8 [Rhodamnia argentea]|uniref:Protein NLP8 n=1 Tax=Rhodamnia argentea TaxID=178133 RepID=A0A8B8NZQ3_9MYRT|nr:protein NLP8 [Rhodamnia argentea]